MSFPTRHKYPIQLKAIAKIFDCTPAHICNIHCGRQASPDLILRYKILSDVANGKLPKSAYNIAQILNVHMRTVQKIITNTYEHSNNSNIPEKVFLLLDHLNCKADDLFSKNQQTENQQTENQQTENQQTEKTFSSQNCYLLFDGDKMLKAFWAKNPRLVQVENL